MVGPLVKWDHNISWPVPTLKPKHFYAGTVLVNLNEPEFSHFCGHEVGGKIFMPGMGYVVSILMSTNLNISINAYHLT